MDMAASLMNDTAKTFFSYVIQLPYLQMANRSLEKDFILNEVPLQLEVSAVIPVLAGAKELTLPADFFIPLKLEERRTGSTNLNDFVGMTERRFERGMTAELNLNEWTFREGSVQFNESTENKDIRLTYYRLIPTIANENTVLVENGAFNTLGFKTAEFLSKYIVKDEARAMALMNDYQNELDNLLSVYVKNSQSKRVRRKPFRRTR